MKALVLLLLKSPSFPIALKSQFGGTLEKAVRSGWF